MNYYWFNRQEISEKEKENYSKEKAVEYYKQLRERYKNLSQEEKDKIKEYQRKKYQELVQYKKEALKNSFVCFFFNIKNE